MRELFLKAQRMELTEYHVYTKLASITKDKKNKKILTRIAHEELEHYEYLKSVTKKDVGYSKIDYLWHVGLARLFGLTFALKLMERGEHHAQKCYEELAKKDKKAAKLIQEEHEHERELLNMLEEEKLQYAGSIVLGLNDALVELTGALAGFTFALQDARLIGVIGLITGFAASLSMAASGYLQSEEEGSDEKNPLTSALYTGIAYIFTVILLVLPFFLMNNVFIALAITLTTAIVIIYSYTYYITVAKSLPFWGRFGKMAGISLGVSLLSFGVGYLLKHTLGIAV